MAEYHEAQLAVLVDRFGAAVDGFRDGRLYAFEVDQTLLQYSRAAKELWKFCTLGPPGHAARMIEDQPSIDWWERALPKRR